jgi:hypothetical protein
MWTESLFFARQHINKKLVAEQKGDSEAENSPNDTLELSSIVSGPEHLPEDYNAEMETADQGNLLRK